jgi:hypothetical protein
MSLAIEKSVNIVLGAGKVLFNPRNSDGTYQGYRLLAETPGFTLTAQGETLPVDGSDGPIAERIRDIPIRVTRSARLTLRDVTPDNQALFVIGDVSTVAQSNTPVVDEAIVVQPGRLYQLGASTSNPGGVRNVSSVDVQDETDTTTYVLDTDYKLHADIGMIEILEGGAIGEETLHVDYTPATENRSRVTSHQQGPARGELRFLADNTEGDNADVLIPDGLLTPDGELPFKSRENVQEMAFNLALQTRDGYAQVYIDGRAA